MFKRNMTLILSSLFVLFPAMLMALDEEKAVLIDPSEIKITGIYHSSAPTIQGLADEENPALPMGRTVMNEMEKINAIPAFHGTGLLLIMTDLRIDPILDACRIDLIGDTAMDQNLMGDSLLSINIIGDQIPLEALDVPAQEEVLVIIPTKIDAEGADDFGLEIQIDGDRLIGSISTGIKMFSKQIPGDEIGLELLDQTTRIIEIKGSRV